MKLLLFLSFFTLLNINLCHNELFKLKIFDESTEALCLDGSPYGIYSSPGLSDGNKNIIINFWGGGWCSGRDNNSFFSDCYYRTQTDRGSSNPWPREKTNNGFLSGEKLTNPNFFSWNRFDIPYCDGTGHQGHLTDPVVYEGNNLYFRGHKNTLAALNYIFTSKNLKQIEKIVITGGSAGGLSTYYWAQYISTYVNSINPKIKVFGLPISGFFIDHINLFTNDKDYSIKQKILYDIVNKEVAIENNDCVVDYKGEEYKCLLAENLTKYIKIPFLIIQPGYDTWQLHNTLGIDCSDNNTLETCDDKTRLIIGEYKNNQNSLIFQYLRDKSNISAWVVSCVIHDFGDKELNSWEIPFNSGNSINRVVKLFLETGGEKIALIDAVDWPLNKSCN